MVKNLPASAKDKRHGFSPWAWKISWSGNVYPLQYSCMENSMDGGTRRATVHGVTKGQTRHSTTQEQQLRLRLSLPGTRFNFHAVGLKNIYILR